jgi:hypothetical protein
MIFGMIVIFDVVFLALLLISRFVYGGVKK